MECIDPNTLIIVVCLAWIVGLGAGLGFGVKIGHRGY